jgi:hypothetical protein
MPTLETRELCDIKRLFIHCSLSEYGTDKIIDKWHRERGFFKIGYHFVIYNGYLSYKDLEVRQGNVDGYSFIYDGFIVKTDRALTEVGAHCSGQNKDSIGICLIGRRKFTANQFEALAKLVNDLCEQLNLDHENDVYCHYEFTRNKTCPNFKKSWLKHIIAFPLEIEKKEGEQ